MNLSTIIDDGPSIINFNLISFLQAYLDGFGTTTTTVLCLADKLRPSLLILIWLEYES